MALSKGQSKGRYRVTINDLSRELGLTKGTVSRALNGYDDISESTRTRVARAAERMGYRPLAQAQAIRTGMARALGLVLNAGPDNTHKPFLTDFLDGISRAASEEGWSLSIATALDEQDEVATIARLVAEHKVDGFILPRTRVSDPRIDLLRDLEVPFVLYGRTGDTEGCAWHDISGEDAMRDAVLRLHGLGHQRIGFVNGDSGFNYAPLRRDGYLAGLAEAGLPHDPTFAVDTRAAGARLAKLLFARIRGADLNHLREVVPAHLIARGSDGPPPNTEPGPARNTGPTPPTQKGET